MRSEPFDLVSGEGRRLSARLDRPDVAPGAFALFAHCFTCDKTSKAAVRISRALAEHGFGVLRLDFTGLGDSEGEITGFSGNVEDLIGAARQMAAKGLAPALLVGHSFGGAAVLAAAGEIASAKAVATLGAPASPAHVLKLLGDDIATIEADGRATVRIGGRPFVLDRAFVQDARMQDLPDRIARLGRALLVLHSPTDGVVGIENASAIFRSARHPKSFVSLDTADHLMTKAEDANYAAAVTTAWAGRYVGKHKASAPTAEAPPEGCVLVEETGAGTFQVEVVVGQTRFLCDEPANVGGLGAGPGPYDLVAAGLGACTSMTLRLYAERKGWPLERVRVRLTHRKDPAADPPDQFQRRIGLEGSLSDDQVARLFEIADKCPVHRTLERGSRVATAPLVSRATDPPAGAPEEHFRDMESECRNSDVAAASAPTSAENRF